MNDWAELDRALVAMAASGSTEVREDGEWLAELAALHCELHREGKNPLVHLWSAENNLTRRILRVRENRRIASCWRSGDSAAQDRDGWNFCAPIRRAPPDASRANNFARACAASLRNVFRTRRSNL